MATDSGISRGSSVPWEIIGLGILKSQLISDGGEKRLRMRVGN